MKKEFLAIALLIAAMVVVGSVSAAVGGDGNNGEYNILTACTAGNILANPDNAASPSDNIAYGIDNGDRTSHDEIVGHIMQQQQVQMLLRSQPQAVLEDGSTNDEGISGNNDLVGHLINARDSW